MGLEFGVSGVGLEIGSGFPVWAYGASCFLGKAFLVGFTF